MNKEDNMNQKQDTNTEQHMNGGVSPEVSHSDNGGLTQAAPLSTHEPASAASAGSHDVGHLCKYPCNRVRTGGHAISTTVDEDTWLKAIHLRNSHSIAIGPCVRNAVTEEILRRYEREQASSDQTGQRRFPPPCASNDFRQAIGEWGY